MKKTGIFNQQLASEVAATGHGQSILICDVGYPIPADSIKVDLALCKGIPTTMQVLRTILSELVVESFIIAKEAEEHNLDFFKQVNECLPNQKKTYLPQDEFMVESIKVSKFVVRSADMNPMANIVITAASAVEKFKKGFDIIPLDE